MHQSFVTTAPTLLGRVGDSWAKVWGSYFSSAAQCRGNDIRILTPGRFSIVKSSAKSKVLTSSLLPRGGAYHEQGTES